MPNNPSEISTPEIAVIAITRVALGVGLGLLLAPKLSADRRKGAGWALFTIGVATTLPLAYDVFANQLGLEPLSTTD